MRTLIRTTRKAPKLYSLLVFIKMRAPVPFTAHISYRGSKQLINVNVIMNKKDANTVYLQRLLYRVCVYCCPDPIVGHSVLVS